MKPNVLRLLGGLIRARPGTWALSALTASVMFYVFPLIPGLVFQRLLDRLVERPTLDSGARFLLLVLLAVWVGRALTIVVANLAEYATTLLSAALVRRNVLAGILRRPAAKALPGTPGDAISRFSSDAGEAASMVSWLADPVGQGVVFVVGLLVLVKTSTFLTVVVVLPVLAVAAVANLLGHRVERTRVVLQEALGDRSGVLGDLFNGVAAIQLAGAARAAVAHLDRSNERVRKAVLRDVLISRSLMVFSQNIGNMGVAVLLLASAGRIRSGDISVGDLALFVAYIGHLAETAVMTGWMSVRFRQAGVSLGRVMELAPGEPQKMLTARTPLYLRGPLPAPPQPARFPSDRLDLLEVRGLTYKHDGTGKGIREVDLQLPRGSMTVVTGQVGAGKTTLLRCVLGLLPAEAGEVIWNGELIEPATALIPPRAAYTPQAPRCFTDSLAANVRFGYSADDDAVRAALHAAVMEADLARFPEGLDTQIGPRGLKLSGGQLLRAAAARMFIRTPELYVVDDLSSGLDVDTEAELWRRLRGADGTWLIVSHRAAAIAIADQVVILEDGAVAAAGNPDELSGHPFISHIRSGAPADVPIG